MLQYKEIWGIVNRWGIKMRKTRLVNLVLLIGGIIGSKSACLSAIVRHYSIGAVGHTHHLKQPYKLFKNAAIEVEDVVPMIAAVIWQYRPGGKRTSLVPIALY